MAEQKNNKGFGALDDLSSDIDEKSSNTKAQTPVRKTIAPKVKKTLPPVRKKNVNVIKKSPAVKREQKPFRNKRIKSDSPSQEKNFNKPFFSPQEIKYLWIALFIILVIFINKDESENSSNKQETSIGTTYNYSETKTDQYYIKPSNESLRLVDEGWANMTKKSAVDNPDYQLAFEQNLKAFNLGHPEGATNLGNIYEYGLGVPKDLNYAISWYSNAIKRGAYHSADAELGIIRCTLKLKNNLDKNDFDNLYEYVFLAKKKATEFNAWWVADRDRFLAEANDLKNKLDLLEARYGKKESQLAEIESHPTEIDKPIDKAIVKKSESTYRGYVSLYTDRKTYGVFGWSAGYKTQDEANQAAYDNCMERGARNSCEYLYGSYAKCVAIAQSRKWIQAGVGETKDEAEESAQSLCDKHGESCIIPADGSGCAK
jgi:hypothetical protein